MSDAFEGLMRWNEEIKALPEPVAYIVLEHWHPSRVLDGRDAKGRTYVRVSAAILDEVRHTNEPPTGLAALTGIPVYKRENMPEGWPDA